MPSVTRKPWYPSLSDQIKMTRQAHSWSHSAPWQCKASYGTLAGIQVGGSPSIQSRPLLQLCHFWSPKKALRGKWFTSDNNVKQYVRDWYPSPGNFTRQPFTALCRSGTSAWTASANTSDIQVLVSVPRPPDRFLFNASHSITFTKILYWNMNEREDCFRVGMSVSVV